MCNIFLVIVMPLWCKFEVFNADLSCLVCVCFDVHFSLGLYIFYLYVLILLLIIMTKALFKYINLCIIVLLMRDFWFQGMLS